MKEGPSRKKKLLSKLERLRIRDDIARFLRESPLKEVEESQVGNHVYSGSGRVRIGTSYAAFTVRIRMVGGSTMMYFRAPSAGISVACTFEPRGAAAAVRKAVRDSVN